MNTNTHTPVYVSTDRFSLKRMMDYLRFYCRIEGRTLLYAVGTIFGITVAVFLITLLTNISMYQYGYAELRQMPGYDPMWTAERNWAMFLIFLLAAVGGSMVYGRFSTKSSRLEVLTMPTTGTEKLTAWLIVYIIGGFAAWFACIMCADILRVIVMHVFTPYGSQVHVISPWNLLTFNKFDTCSAAGQAAKWLVDIYGLALFLQALFALGSIYLPRYSFFKTSCVLVVLLCAAALLCVLGMKVFFGDDAVTSAFDYSDEITKSRIIWSAVGWIVASGLIYWLGYARMKQTEVALKW